MTGHESLPHRVLSSFAAVLGVGLLAGCHSGGSHGSDTVVLENEEPPVDPPPTTTCSRDDECPLGSICDEHEQCVTACPGANLVPIHFDFEQAMIRLDQRPSVAGNALCLRAWRDQVVGVIGHTDVGQSPGYDLVLGERCATSVAQALEELGVDAERMRLETRGSREPVCTEPTEACRRQNRRVDLVWAVVSCASDVDCALGTLCDGGACREACSDRTLPVIRFDPDESVVRPGQEAALQQLAECARGWREEIVLRGHTAQVEYQPPEGEPELITPSYAMAFGERRARAVRDELESLGVDSERVDVISMGLSVPLCSEEGEACWSQNRRVEAEWR